MCNRCCCFLEKCGRGGEGRVRVKLFESSTEEFEDSKEITSTRFTFCWNRFQSIVIGPGVFYI